MVTTIKITCDGVFIQSETYNITRSTTTIANTDTSFAKKMQSKPKNHLMSELALKNYQFNEKITSTKTFPEFEAHNKGLSCKIRNDCRNRYYFGTNNTYFCKNNEYCNNGSKHNVLTTKVNSDYRNIKEMQEYSLKPLDNIAGITRYKDVKMNYNQKCNMTIDLRAKHEYIHYCEKYREPSQFVCSKSIILAKNGFKRKNSVCVSNKTDMIRQSSVKSCISLNDQNLIDNNNLIFQPDTRFKSFFRSARNFYRTSSERSITTSIVDAKSNDRASMILKRPTTIFDTIIENLPKTNKKSTTFYDDWVG